MPHSAARAADKAVAQAMISHHAHLAAGLNQHVDALVEDVDTGYLLKAGRDRRSLLGYLRAEILPHARAEENALYPAAADLPEGRLLVAGMIDEHQALTGLVDEVAGAETLVRAAAAARAFASLFAVHLHKENDLVLPLLLAARQGAFDQILAGMHEILGSEHTDTIGGTGATAAGAEPNGHGEASRGDAVAQRRWTSRSRC